MVKRYKLTALIIIVAMSLSLFAGCASKKDSAESSEPTATVVDINKAEKDSSSSGEQEENILTPYLNHQYYFNGQPIPMEESNYYMIVAFSELTQYSAYYDFPTTQEGFIDLSASYNYKSEDGHQYKLWGDFLIEYAETQLQYNYVLLENAKLKNITLSSSEIGEIEDFVDELQNGDYSDTSDNPTMEIYYKFIKSCSSESVVNFLANQTLATRYGEKYITSYQYSDEELAQCVFPHVRYALFYAPSGSSEEDLEKARVAAEEFLGTTSNLEGFQASGNIYQVNGGLKEYGDDYEVVQGNNPPELEAWAYDENRKEGDIEIIKSESIGYFVIGYLGMKENADMKALIATDKLQEETTKIVESKTYEFYCKDSYDLPYEAAPAPDSKPTKAPQATPSTETTEKNSNSDGAGSSLGNNTVLLIVIVAIGSITVGGAVGALVFSIMSKKKKKEE